MYAYRRTKPEAWARRIHVIFVTKVTDRVTPAHHDTRKIASTGIGGSIVHKVNGICTILEGVSSAHT
jgi:hypothetical protein